MKILINAISVFIFVIYIVKPQPIPDYLLPENQIYDKAYLGHVHKPKYNPELLKEYVELDKRNYDVLRYDLYMDWFDIINDVYDGSFLRFNGVNTIQLVILEDNLEYIELDAQLLNIEKIMINGQPSMNSNKKPLGILTVDFNEPFNTGDTVVLEIKYNYISSDNERGINVYEKGTPIDLGPPPNHDTVYIEEKIVYTMSEPVDARVWMPCNDRPYDKALSSISIKVPIGYDVTANGILNSILHIADANYSIYYWQHDFPIPTYLMHVAASKFHYSYDWYKRVSNPQDSIKIEYFVWEKDFLDTTSDGLNYNSTYAFRNSVEMMEFYSTIFGEYPFERYGMVAVQDCWFGGMEHQTITTLNRNVLRKMNRWGGNSDNGNQNVMAHELAHQWLGDLITCASWNDIWINEGGASWSEALWSGRNYPIYYDYSMLGKMQTFMRNNGTKKFPAVYNQPVGDIFANYEITYLKAASVYHMLSVMFGKENFLQMLREMFSEFAYKSLDTEEFKNFLKTKVDNPPVDLDTFFNQWIYKAGHPVYLVTKSTRTFVPDEDYEVTVNLAQLQEGDDVPDVYRNIIFLKFYGPNDAVRIDSIVNNEKNENFIFRLAFEPDSVEIDTIKTLCTVASYITLVENENRIDDLTYNLYPNPINQGNKGYLNLQQGKDSNIEIELFDNYGRKISTIQSGSISSGNHLFTIPTDNLASGIYSLIIKTNGNYRTQRFTVIN